MNARALQPNWALVIATIGGLVLAVFLGATLGDNDYYVMMMVVLPILFVMYVIYFVQFTWQIALLIAYLGFLYRPLGFQVSSIEITCALGFLLIALTVWQKRSFRRPQVLNRPSFSLVRLSLLVWVVYAGIHMIYNVKYPFRPADFALKNALKSYFEVLAPPVLVLYFSRHPGGVRTKGNIVRTVAILMLVGVIANLLVTAFRILTHHDIVDPDADLYTMTFVVPGINAVENFYQLRTLGPAAILFGATSLSLGPLTSGVSRRLSILLLLTGLIGSVLSGGRAAAVAAVSLVTMMLVFRKQIRAFFIILMLFGIFVLLANLFGDWINHKAPVAIARPFQWVMLNKSSTASGSIESSSQWREELIKRAIAEWRSDPRIFWFGRATYGFGVSDYVAMGLAGSWEASQESSLRRGATHNLVTDLLVTSGLIGCILYYCLVLAIVGFLWSIYRSRNLSGSAKSLTLICLVSSIAHLCIATFGGGYYPIELTWLLIILIALLYREGAGKVANVRSAEVMPQRELQFSR